MVGGRMYINTPSSIGAAIDAKTGKTLWVYNPKSYEAGTTTMSARWNQRGVAYWTDGKEERVLWGTSDGYLLAVDAKTGIPVKGFGENGKVDLMQSLPHAKRGSRDWLNALTYSVQSPPIVVRDTVIVPASISSFNVVKEQIPGWTRGWDVRTGKLKWTFHTVPRPGEFGNDTWLEDSWSFTGKVSGWSIYSADAELGYVYLPLIPRRRIITAAIGPATACSANRWCASMSRPASGCGTTSSCITVCGITIRRPRRTCST